MKYKINWILYLLMFAGPLLAGSPVGEYSKTIQKEFNISSNGLVHISNKYGDVNVNSWDQNTVQIDVLIKVDAPSESKAKEMFEKIHIEFENSDDYVKAWTNLEEMSKTKWFWEKAKKYKYSIDYEVKAPASNELFVHNKYGNTYIGNFNNDVELEIKYGDLTVGDIDGAVTTQIKYGNAQFQDIGNLNLTSGYANINGMDAGDLRVESKYSQISFHKVGDVMIDSKYDEYNIEELDDFINSGKYDAFSFGKVRSIELESRYTNLQAENLLMDARFNMDYGAVKIKNISPACSRISIEAKHTGIKLYSNIDFQLELDSKYTDVKLPNNFTSTVKEKDGSELHLRGYSGSKNTDTKILAQMKYGNLYIQQ